MNRNIIILIFFILLLYLLYLLFKPFIIPLFWAGIIASVLNPPYLYFERRFKKRETFFAFFFTLSVFLIIVIPTIFVIFLLAQESIDAYNKYREILVNLNFSAYLDKYMDTSWGSTIKKFLLSSEQAESVISKYAGSISKFLFNQAQILVKNTGLLLFRLLIMFLGVFFFLRDGKRILEHIRKLLPLDESIRDVIFKRLGETVNAVVIGMIVTAIVQGFLLSIGFLIFGVGYPVLFGALTFVLALLPFGGALPVWLGGAIYLFLNERIGAGIGLLIWGALLVSSIDNFLKPILIGEKTQIPFFLLFLSLLGGIMAFGLTGLFLGPVLVALLLTILMVFEENRMVGNEK